MAAFVPPAGLIEGTGAYATWSAYRRQVYLNELYGEWLHTPVDGVLPDTTGLIAPVVSVAPGSSETNPNRQGFTGSIASSTAAQRQAAHDAWVGSLGWAQMVLNSGASHPQFATAVGILQQAALDQKLAKAGEVRREAWSKLMSVQRADRGAMTPEYVAAKAAYDAANAAYERIKGTSPLPVADMSGWAAGYAAQQAKYAAAGGEAAYWASQGRGYVWTPENPEGTPAEPGYAPPAPHVIAPLANAPSRAALDTINQVAEEMLAKEKEEPEAATLALASLPGYKPIKLRPRT